MPGLICPVSLAVEHAESAHQKGATDQVEAMARDLEFTRAELASAKQNLDKAHSDQSKVCCYHFAYQLAQHSETANACHNERLAPYVCK